MENVDKIALFEEKHIRKMWHNGEWYFSVVDVIEVLTDSPKPSNYWDTMKRRDPQISAICGKLKMKGIDGKSYATAAANTEGLLRIIMSVPSPKAEPFKLWLAQVGKERIEETENPELSFERMTEMYRAKGHTDKWIKERMQSITTRKELTDEWKNRGVKEGQEYGILTATIAKGTFGLTPSEHSQLKGLERQNLRDHMTPFELILTALSEEATRFLTVREDAQGFNDNHDAAVKGGYIGGTARQNLEKQLGETIISKENFVGLNQEKNTPDELLNEGKTTK